MEKTTHYQLNQWAPDDRIMRTDFNGDNAAIDEALHENVQALADARSALEGALETERQARASGDAAGLNAVAAEQTAREQAVAAEQTAREQAVTAEANARNAADTAEANTRSQQDAAIRSELASAVAEAKSEASNAVNNEANTRAWQDSAIRQEFAAADVQLRSENMVVKLADVTTSADTTQIDVNMSGIDLRNYVGIYIVPRIITTDSQVAMRLNNIPELCYYVNGTYCNAMCFFSSNFRNSFVRLLMQGPTDYLSTVTISGSLYNPDVAMANNTYVSPASLQTLNFFSPGNKGLSAGSQVLIYGLRK